MPDKGAILGWAVLGFQPCMENGTLNLSLCDQSLLTLSIKWSPPHANLVANWQAFKSKNNSLKISCENWKLFKSELSCKYSPPVSGYDLPIPVNILLYGNTHPLLPVHGARAGASSSVGWVQLLEKPLTCEEKLSKKGPGEALPGSSALCLWGLHCRLVPHPQSIPVLHCRHATVWHLLHPDPPAQDTTARFSLGLALSPGTCGATLSNLILSSKKSWKVTFPLFFFWQHW